MDEFVCVFRERWVAYFVCLSGLAFFFLVLLLFEFRRVLDFGQLVCHNAMALKAHGGIGCRQAVFVGSCFVDKCMVHIVS